MPDGVTLVGHEEHHAPLVAEPPAAAHATARAADRQHNSCLTRFESFIYRVVAGGVLGPGGFFGMTSGNSYRPRLEIIHRNVTNGPKAVTRRAGR